MDVVNRNEEHRHVCQSVEILYAIEQSVSLCCISFKSHSLGLFHGGCII